MLASTTGRRDAAPSTTLGKHDVLSKPYIAHPGPRGAAAVIDHALSCNAGSA
jgi:hypothetical protein